jgi:hypothetical protein
VAAADRQDLLGHGATFPGDDRAMTLLASIFSRSRVLAQAEGIVRAVRQRG